jgi:hypothetical protein
MTTIMTKSAALGATAALVALPLAACHSGGSAAAKAKASAAANNPQVKRDETRLANKMLACAKQQHHVLHFVKHTVNCAFPGADSKKIISFAEGSFTVSVVTSHGPGSARDKWAQGVANYALSLPGAR